MSVISAVFGKKAPSDLSKILRDFADDVDARIITAMVISCTRDGEYNLTFAASIEDSLVLSTLLQSSSINKFRG